MKHIATTIIALLWFSTIGLAQERESSNNPLLTVNEVSKNNLSETVTAHTYKLSGIKSIESNDADLTPPSNLSEEIEDIRKLFLSVEGVTRCTFDRATSTFTVITLPETSLKSIAIKINQIH